MAYFLESTLSLINTVSVTKLCYLPSSDEYQFHFRPRNQIRIAFLPLSRPGMVNGSTYNIVRVSSEGVQGYVWLIFFVCVIWESAGRESCWTRNLLSQFNHLFSLFPVRPAHIKLVWRMTGMKAREGHPIHAITSPSPRVVQTKKRLYRKWIKIILNSFPSSAILWLAQNWITSHRRSIVCNADH